MSGEENTWMTNAFFILGYLLPTVVAYFREHRNQMPIFLVNVLFGWTILGWLIALIWSTTDNTRSVRC